MGFFNQISVIQNRDITNYRNNAIIFNITLLLSFKEYVIFKVAITGIYPRITCDPVADS